MAHAFKKKLLFISGNFILSLSFPTFAGGGHDFSPQLSGNSTTTLQPQQQQTTTTINVHPHQSLENALNTSSSNGDFEAKRRRKEETQNQKETTTTKAQPHLTKAPPTEQELQQLGEHIIFFSNWLKDYKKLTKAILSIAENLLKDTKEKRKFDLKRLLILLDSEEFYRIQLRTYREKIKNSRGKILEWIQNNYPTQGEKKERDEQAKKRKKSLIERKESIVKNLISLNDEENEQLSTLLTDLLGTLRELDTMHHNPTILWIEYQALIQQLQLQQQQLQFQLLLQQMQQDTTEATAPITTTTTTAAAASLTQVQPTPPTTTLSSTTTTGQRPPTAYFSLVSSLWSLPF